MSTRTPNPAIAFAQIQYPSGSRVKLSAFGKSNWLNCNANPHNCEGIIYGTSIPKVINPKETSTLGVSVTWDNGSNNAYNAADLDIISVPFKAGDRVAMSEFGKAKFDHCGYNPHNVMGLISRPTDYDSDRYIVEWPNNCTNGYKSIELMLVEPIANKLEEKKFVSVTERELTVKPAFLKAAYKAACSEWKEKLQKEYPDFEFVKPERTYASGDTICIDTAWGATDYAIVHTAHNEIILVNKEGFAPWTEATKVANQSKITVAELNAIVGRTTTWHGKSTASRYAK
jgi:hypothetical protein